MPGYTQYLEWGITNAGTADECVAPNAFLYKPTDMAPGYAQDGTATVHTVNLTSDSDWAADRDVPGRPAQRRIDS